MYYALKNLEISIGADNKEHGP